MKHSILFVTVMMLAVFLCGTGAFMQQGQTEQGQPGLSAAKVNSHINSGSRHKLILGSQDVDVYNDLISKAAIVEEIDYGSFKQVIVNEHAAGGREAMRALRVPVRDDQDLILFNGYIIDTSNPEATYAKIPGDLRQTDMFNALSKRSRPRGGLYIVQFAGPIKDLWLGHLKSTGAEIVTSIASNAYVVRASARAARALIGLKNRHSFAQYLGDYEPVYRLSPRMRDLRNEPAETLVDVTVQVIEGRGASRTINELKALASEFVGSHRALNYHNVSLKVSAGQLGDIARMADVYAIEERGPLQRFDEIQCQIVAGNLSGNAPSGPHYLSFLSNLGISPSQFGSFAVNVVDDAYTLSGPSGHPDLPASRIAFENNPYGLCGPQSGHGFLNAHIVGGFNDGSNFPFEDANGFNYGLGIAPYARVGVTAIPLNSQCNGNPISFPQPPGAIEWESVAYEQGARISTNSWGDPTISHYDARAQIYDSIVRDAQPNTPGLQQMIEVFAVGNDGKQILRDPNGNIIIRPATRTIHTPATAKNVISVGASENVRQFGIDACPFFNTDEHANSANDVAAFSSRGPVNNFFGDAEHPGFVDERTKPDIMAPGTRIVAGIPQPDYTGESVCNKYFPQGQTFYGLSSGTSQAAPAIAGAAALVYAGFVSNGQTISPAMMKAYLMNSTTYMTGSEANDPLPSNNQGMGRLDLTRAFNGQSRLMWDQSRVLRESGEVFQAVGSVHIGPRPFRVTLAWTDAPGPVNNAAYVNDLDLEVTIDGVTYRGNVFSGPNSVSGGNADFRNNVESVFFPVGTVGDFTVRVIARNLRGDGVPGNSDTTDQDFALVISNAFCQPPPVSNLIATASSAARVDLTWSSSLGTLDHFEVERRQNIASPFVIVANVTGTSFSDTTVSSGITYLYRVRAASECGTAFSDYSNTDMATTIIFTDDPLIAGITVVKAQHLLQLRQAVNSVRAAANQGPFNWAEVIQSGVPIKASHVQELRNVLNPARNALGFTSQPFTDNPLVPGVLIKKAHIEEIRQDVK